MDESYQARTESLISSACEGLLRASVVNEDLLSAFLTLTAVMCTGLKLLDCIFHIMSAGTLWIRSSIIWLYVFL